MAEPQNFSPYQLLIKDDSKLLDLTKSSIRNFSRFYIISDIFKFYPYSEIYYYDLMGAIIDSVFFIEGLKLNIKLGNDKIGFLEHDYCWSENQINDIQYSTHIAGNNIFILQSYYSMQDNEKSRAWTNKKISEVITDLVKKDWNLVKNSDVRKNKVFISDTDGLDNYCQVAATNEKYIKNLSVASVSQANSKSPFVTFINSAGEFYFCPLNYLFLEQQPVAEYALLADVEASMKSNVIKDYVVLFGGLPFNKKGYIRDIYTISKTGAYVKQQSMIEDYFIKKDATEKILVRNSQRTFQQFVDFGIEENDKDTKFIQGKINSLYVNSALSYRMEVMLQFDPKLVTGRLITLKIGTALAKKQTMTELAGTWLIIRDEHFIDYDGIPFSKVTVAKSGIKLDANHLLKKEMLPL